jgi:hypothetical protein
VQARCRLRSRASQPLRDGVAELRDRAVPAAQALFRLRQPGRDGGTFVAKRAADAGEYFDQTGDEWLLRIADRLSGNGSPGGRNQDEQAEEEPANPHGVQCRPSRNRTGVETPCSISTPALYMVASGFSRTSSA